MYPYIHSYIRMCVTQSASPQAHLRFFHTGWRLGLRSPRSSEWAMPRSPTLQLRKYNPTPSCQKQSQRTDQPLSSRATFASCHNWTRWTHCSPPWEAWRG